MSRLVYKRSGGLLKVVYAESIPTRVKLLQDRIHYWEMVRRASIEGAGVWRYCTEQIARCQREINELTEAAQEGGVES